MKSISSKMPQIFITKGQASLLRNQLQYLKFQPELDKLTKEEAETAKVAQALENAAPVTALTTALAHETAKAAEEVMEKKISALNLTKDQKAAAASIGYRAKAALFAYDVKVCIISIPASVQAKATATCRWANASNKNRGIALLSVAGCALAVAGCVSGYRNQAAVISYGSDVLSSALKACAKYSSVALKFVAEQAATASAALAR